MLMNISDFKMRMDSPNILKFNIHSYENIKKQVRNRNKMCQK